VEVFDLNDPTKVIDHRIIKLDGYTLKHGIWTFYDPVSGKVDKTEKWNLDKPATGNSGDDLAPIDIADNTTAKSDSAKKYPKPQAILDYEKKNKKKKIKVRDGSTGY